ncbi:MAG: DUF4168 domain-containing protein [Candidimonas sp.]|nr:DUF4168 domain-containing protein [Candidimonas sp.]
MQKPILTAVAAGLLTLGLAAGSASAQQAPAQAQSAAPMNVPTPDYSNAQLERFVNASKKVAMISQEYTPKLEASTDDATKNKVFQEADAKMVKAVHEEGMTVDQFNGINMALQRDPELIKRVQEVAK